MRAGQLNRFVIIQRRVAGQDALGQPATTWTSVASVWASVRHEKGVEAIKANRDTSVVQASIRLRRRTDLTAGMRVLLGSTVYEIKALLPDEQDRERLDLVCEVVDG